MITPYVEIKNVALKYGQDSSSLALDSLNISVHQGEFVAVVGPSGCGKSSLMKLVTGLQPVTNGSIVVGSQVVKSPLNFVGMAFQNSSLLPWRSVIENVLLPMEIVQPYAKNFKKNYSEYADKASALLKLVGLGGYENKLPWQLSGGMQQRVQLCRAVIHEPSLLMLDEPFGALDMFTREELWAILQDLWIVKKPTIILVTHDLREAVFLADRVLVMSSRPGKIIHELRISEGRPRHLKATYQKSSVDAIAELRECIQEARIVRS
jgi:NitT/TauT family transport system ATP-binding protein